ncbi:MAG: hypothetical protein KAV87_22105, partial [Desulfobacteraceae bacterium]|nr:hypothetical protein [Desulfobacteraceae bacterium]
QLRQGQRLLRNGENMLGQSVHHYFDRMRGISNNIALDCGFFILDSESKGCRFYAMPHILDIHTIEVYEG